MVRSRSAMSCLLVRRVWLASGRCLQRRPDALTILLWAPSFFQDCVRIAVLMCSRFLRDTEGSELWSNQFSACAGYSFQSSSGKAQVAAHVASEWQLGAVVIEVRLRHQGGERPRECPTVHR